MQSPVKAKELGVLLSTESRQYLDREDFLFLLLRAEGVTEYEGCTIMAL